MVTTWLLGIAGTSFPKLGHRFNFEYTVTSRARDKETTLLGQYTRLRFGCAGIQNTVTDKPDINATYPNAFR